MTHFLQKTKKLIAISAVFALLLLQNSALILGLHFFSNSKKVNEVFATYNSTEISLSNSNFETGTSTNYPITASSWSKLDADNSVIAGIINVSQDEYVENYEEEYELNFNPSKPENVPTDEYKVLMLNAKNINTKMGYQSSSFILSENGYYTVSVWVYTQNSDGISSNASLYLTGDDQTEQNANSKILSINTQGNWKEYTFYVQTSANESKTLNLELYLGSKDSILSKGAVFFDEVTITSHSHDTYYTNLNNLNYTQNNYSILNYTEKKLDTAIVNADFEADLTGWEVLSENNSNPNSSDNINGVYPIDGNFNSEDTGVATTPGTANFYDNHKALLINNTKEASIGYESDDILIEQHKLYRLSVWAKTGELSDGATIKLIQQNPYGEDNETYTPASQTISGIDTSNSSSEKYDDWVQYSFYIKGNVFFDSLVNLQLWLGDEDQTQTGYVFFDNIELFELTSEQYDNYSASTTEEEVDLSNLSASPTFTNGNFNKVTIENVENSYPYSPSDWTLSSSSDNYEYAELQNGVINTKQAHFDANSDNYSFVNPGNLNNQTNYDITNNVLVIGNKTPTSQTYTSSSTVLNAQSYYKLSFYVQTQNLSENAVSVNLLSSGNSIYTLNKLESNLTWTKYEVYLETSLEDVTASLQLNLGNENQEVTGYAFFDNVFIAEVESSDYENVETSSTIKKVDLNYQNFNAISNQSTNGLYTPLNFTGSLEAGEGSEFIQAGVLNTEEFNSNYFVGIANPGSASDNSNVLVIASNVDSHYTYTSNYSYNFNAGTYYKFSVFVKTQSLTQAEENTNLGDNNQAILFGASVKLSGFDKEFTGINTQINETTNEYTEYTFYILSASDKTSNLVLSLGSSDALTKGYAFFSNISLNEITEDSYNEALETINSANPPNTMLNLQNDEIDSEDEDENEDEAGSEEGGINFDFLLLPTLLFGISLIIAIVGYAMRQVKFNRIIRRRIKTDIYDRNRTLAVDHERREVIKARQAKLKKLQEEQAKFKKEIEEADQNYKNTKHAKENYVLTQEDRAKVTVLIEEKIKKANKKLAALIAKLQKEFKLKESKLSKEELQNLKAKQKTKTQAFEEKQAKETKAYEKKQLKLIKQAKQKELKQQKEQAYLEKRERLQREFDKVTKEIEKLEREERILFEKYRNYKAQVRAIKQEIKQKTKAEKIKRKQKKLKEKNKKKANSKK